jgi:transaldolase
LIKIFADTSDFDTIISLNNNPFIRGFTTNPSIMHKDGVKNYEEFAKSILKEVTEKPISFEIIEDDLNKMQYQAEKIASWGENVYVKIPIMNTKRSDTSNIMRAVSQKNIKINATAIMLYSQAKRASEALYYNTKSIISVFAGRISDTGVDAEKIMQKCREYIDGNDYYNQELLWASPRELYNIIQAEKSGANIITITPFLINKLLLFGKNLEDFSLETIQGFYEDSKKSGYTL